MINTLLSGLAGFVFMLKLRNLRRNTPKNKNIFYLCHAIGRWRTY